MKKHTVLFCILAVLLICGACGHRQAAPEGSKPAETGSAAPQGDALRLRVIDGAGTAQLVLAGEAGGELYTAAAKELTLFVDGEPASPDALQNGMLLSFDPDVTVLESWPAQLVGATARVQNKSEPETDHGDLCGLYLQVLEDLWTEDSGLNGDISYISVDLDAAPGGLTDGEKAAIAWIFSGRHNAEGLRLGFRELQTQGYVKDLYWEDGVLLSITQSENKQSTAKKLSFNAQKWRSGTGAIFFTDCTAKRGNGAAWEPYQPGGFAIS